MLPISGFFSGSMGSKVKEPMHTTGDDTFYKSGVKIVGFNNFVSKFWHYFKTSPELMSPIRVLVTDVIGDRPQWFDARGNPLGRNKLLKVKDFWRGQRGKEIIKAWLIDSIITGDGYLWKNKTSFKDKLVAIKEATKQYKDVFGAKEYNELLLRSVASVEDKFRIDYIASSTVTYEADDHKIIKYYQTVNGNTAEFDPEEIIHLRFMTVNGELGGFTPIKSLVRELVLLYFVKGNMLAYLENGGNPDKIFVLENENVNSPNYKRFEQQLVQYQSLKNRHGSLLGTGKLNVIDLNNREKDLEYKELALFITSNIAYAIGVPVNRIPYLIGTSASKGDSGGMAESGYWNYVSEIQDHIEDLLNYNLFIPYLGATMQLNRKYKQDVIRDAQALSMNSDSVQKIQSILRSKGKELSIESICKMLGLSKDDLEDAKQIEEYPKTMNQNLLDDKSLLKEPDNRKKAASKRNIANARINKSLSV